MNWWRKFRWQFAAHRQQLARGFKLLELQHQYALYGNSRLANDGFAKAQEAANRIYRQLLAETYGGQGESSGNENERMIQLYSQTVGDLNDPEWLAAEEARVAAWLAERKQQERSRPQLRDLAKKGAELRKYRQLLRPQSNQSRRG